jgi:Ca2+-binding RTX toxin-like protein
VPSTTLVRTLAVSATALALTGVGVVGAQSGAVDGQATVSACNLAAQADPDANVVTGATTGDDTLTGTSGPDIIDGAAGDDKIQGRGGDDLLCGGDGDDVFIAGPGDDSVHGGEGVDWVQTVDPGADRVDGIQVVATHAPRTTGADHRVSIVCCSP